MTFHGWAYPLEAYTRALEDAGLRIEALREPVGTPEPDERWLRLPMFLIFRVSAIELALDRRRLRDGGSGSVGPPRRRSPGLRRRWVGAVASLVIAD